MSRRRWAAGAGLATGVAVVGVVLVLSSGGPGPRPAPTPVPSTGTSTTATSSAPAISPAPGLPPPSTEVFGANVNLLFNTPGLPDAMIAAQLNQLHSDGATVARSDALWEASEPTAPAGGQHHFDWSFDDRIASLLAAAGLRWLPIIDYSASWAQSISGQDHSPPRSDAEYAAYAAAFAARYGPGGSFWSERPSLPALPVDTIEIWNEPDNGQFWTPTPNAAVYAGLYLTARAAIDARDPSARVIVGGLTRPGVFLTAMLTAAPLLRGHVDGVAVHPYGRPGVVAAKVAQDRKALDAVGLPTVPLYATELGWTTSPPGALDYVPAARRPQYIERSLAELGQLRCGVVAALLYTWYSPERNPADSQQWYGVSAPDAAATPDTAAFAAGLRQGAAPEATRPCD